LIFYKEHISLVASDRIDKLAEQLSENPNEVALIGKIESTISILCKLHLNLNFWRAQNIYFEIGQKFYRKKLEKASKKNKEAQFWIESFDRLGERLQVKIQR